MMCICANQRQTISGAMAGPNGSCPLDFVNLLKFFAVLSVHTALTTQRSVILRKRKARHQQPQQFINH